MLSMHAEALRGLRALTGLSGSDLDWDLDCKIKGVTHAPALRVHSAVLERLALATIVLIGLSLVIVSRGSSGPYLRPSRKSGPYADTRIQPTTWSPKTTDEPAF